jgi:hypothetical protein
MKSIKDLLNNIAFATLLLCIWIVTVCYAADTAINARGGAGVFADGDSVPIYDVSASAGATVTGANIWTWIETKIGSAATRDAEDTLTDGSNLPDGAAVMAYAEATEVNLVNPTDDTWQGKIESAAVYGDATTGYQWAVLYAKDTGSGTRYYLYNADTAASDNDTYGPIAFLVSSGTPTAGDTITVSVGDGVLSNDGWSAAESGVGQPIYAGQTDGYITSTKPSDSGDHIVQIGTLINIAANGRDVWDISFRYPDVTVP